MIVRSIEIAHRKSITKINAPSGKWLSPIKGA